MPPASPDQRVAVRRDDPIAHGTDERADVLDREADRWSLYGDVVSQHVDDQGRAVTVVATRHHGSRLAMRGQLGSNRNRTHTIVGE